tara:strand:- start:58279 stop:59124 length:846 start_codon:yes stop_codon:yes gene_type:complete
MIKKSKLYVLIFFLIFSSISFSQEKVLYKKIGNIDLYMDVYHAEKADIKVKSPAIVFFFGGGWNGGTTSQFKPQAQFFSQRGLSCFLVEYRVKNKHNTTPFESLKDAKSAMRFIRKNSKIFTIDSLKIIGAGGSAGGHLAAATALIEGYNEDQDDLEISCKPNALILFNPVIDNGPGGYGYERINEAYKDFSPLHNIKTGAPPTILFLGTNDKLVPVETAEYYKTVMNKVKSRCDLYLFEGQSHGFFNRKNFKYYLETVSKADEFLQSLGYLDKEPRIKIE